MFPLASFTVYILLLSGRVTDWLLHWTWPLRKPSCPPLPSQTEGCSRMMLRRGSPSTLGAGDGEPFLVAHGRSGTCPRAKENVLGGRKTRRLQPELLEWHFFGLGPSEQIGWEWEGRELSWAPSGGLLAKTFPPTTRERHDFSSGVFASLHMKSATFMRGICFGWRQTNKQIF